MTQEEIQNALDDAKNLLDGVFCGLLKSGGTTWKLNRLITIDLLIKELMKGE